MASFIYRIIEICVKVSCFTYFFIFFLVGVSRESEDALQFLYENDEQFSALPTYAVFLHNLSCLVVTFGVTLKAIHLISPR